MRLRFSFAVLLAAALMSIAVPAIAAVPASQSSGDRLQVTTSSPAAARYFESGMVQYENHRWNLALRDWNEAIKRDPNLAQAYVWICFTTANPAEEAADRAKAKALINRVTPGERFLIQWMANVRENRYLEGIRAMNDMLAMFPRDKRLNFLVGYWLYKQDQYEISQKLTERALAEDPNYATCWNQLAYISSRLGDFDKALQSTAKYIQLLPDQPNPHDSHGEMLRFAGRYQEALEQYRIALKIDPSFYISQKELGETYSLMGDEEQARKEYEKAIQQAPSGGVKAEYLQKYALTYVREKKYAEAEQSYLEAAARAHSMQQWLWEARAYRVMAMFERQPAAALKSLEQAQALLDAAGGKVAQADLDEELAHVLRVRAERALDAGNNDVAQKSMAELEKIASPGSSINLQRTYHGAAGTLLAAQGKYSDAIPQLEEDIANPLSMKLLVTAYRETGDFDEAGNLTRKLNGWKVPSIEEALAFADMSWQKGAVAARN